MPEILIDQISGNCRQQEGQDTQQNDWFPVSFEQFEIRFHSRLRHQKDQPQRSEGTDEGGKVVPDRLRIASEKSKSFRHEPDEIDSAGTYDHSDDQQGDDSGNFDFPEEDGGDSHERYEDDEENIIVGGSKKGVKILPIGIGQGGSKLAQSIGLNNDCKSKCVYINTSTTDINGLELSGNEVTRKITINAKEGDYKTDSEGNVIKDAFGNPIPLEDIDGAGKDRQLSYEYFKRHVGEYVNELKKFTVEEAYDVILVCFSTAGGTGSGIGPRLTKVLSSLTILDEVEAKTGKRPLVFGIAELPELSASKEGSLSYENTLEALDEINEIVNPKDGGNGFARFILVNNGYAKSKYTERTKQLEAVNVATATYIKRYLSEFGVSRKATLDRSDRFNAMKVMGIHAFMSFDGNGNRVESPFIIPDGERVKRCCYEVPENAEVITSNVIASTGCGCDDTVHGFYESGNLNPIIAFHGFRNVSKIAEQYDKRLKQLRENQNRIETDNIYSATGLDDVASEKAKRAAEYGAAGAVGSVEDLF